MSRMKRLCSATVVRFQHRKRKIGCFIPQNFWLSFHIHVYLTWFSWWCHLKRVIVFPPSATVVLPSCFQRRTARPQLTRIIADLGVCAPVSALSLVYEEATVVSAFLLPDIRSMDHLIAHQMVHAHVFRQACRRTSRRCR